MGLNVELSVYSIGYSSFFSVTILHGAVNVGMMSFDNNIF